MFLGDISYFIIDVVKISILLMEFTYMTILSRYLEKVLQRQPFRQLLVLMPKDDKILMVLHARRRYKV